MFSREVNFGPQPSYCVGIIPPFRIVVRFTKDQGLLWSQKYVVAQPVPNTPTGNQSCCPNWVNLYQ